MAVSALKDLKLQHLKYMFSNNSIIYPRDIKLRLHKAGWLKDHLAMQPRFGKAEPLFSKNVYIINYLFTKDNTGAS